MKKKKTQAIALRYDGSSAPRVTAQGEGSAAKQIIKAAKEHAIPIQQNEELTELLSKVRLNDEIPRPLFTAVAQILAFIYYVEGKQETK